MDNIVVPVELEDGLVECDSYNTQGKKRSVAWDHFEKIPTENKEEGKAKCKHCDMIFSATPKSGTSHLRRHVERCPKRVMLDIRPISMECGASDFEISIDCSANRRRTSKVWDEFDKFQTENTEEPKAKCKHCGTVLSAAAKNGTSHLKRHLQKCLRRVSIFGEMNPIIPSFFSKKRKIEGNSSQNDEIGANELVRYISLCIVDGSYPFSMVEKRGFRQMMAKVCPQFTPFSCSVIRRDLYSLYVRERDKVKEYLAKVPGKICLSTESCKATDTEDKYVCVSANFIDDHWKLQRRVLCLRPLVPTFNGVSVADEVAYLLSQWNVEQRTLSITLDDLSYNESIVTSLERGLFTKKLLPLGGCIFQVHCFAHIINLIAESVLKLIGDDLDKIRDLVKHVNRSTIQRKKFFALAENKFELLARKALRVDRPSRWNSTYKLIDHAVYYKNVFMYVVEWDQQLRDEAWERLSMVHRFLKILYDVTCMVAGSKYPTANIYLKGLLMVHRRLLEVSRGPQVFLTDTIRQMEIKFDNYWSENSLILSCAAILDPRYKVKFLEYCYMKLSGNDNVGDRVNRVVNTLYCMLAEYKRQYSFPPSAGTSSVSTNFPSGGDDGDMFGDYNQFLSMSSKSAGSKSELDMYLEEPSYDLNCDLDVLEFWSKSSIRYPELSLLARDLLSVPVSSSTIKSSFCIGGKTMPGIQGSMLPDCVQALVCLQDWLHAQDSDYPTIQGEDLSVSSEDVGFDDEDDDSVLTDSF